MIDIAGPVPFVVEGARLASLAEGEQPPFPYQDPDIRAMIEAAVAAEPAITGYTLAPGSGADLAVTLRLADAVAMEPARRTAQAIVLALAPRLRRGVELSVELPASRANL